MELSQVLSKWQVFLKLSKLIIELSELFLNLLHRKAPLLLEVVILL